MFSQDHQGKGNQLIPVVLSSPYHLLMFSGTSGFPFATTTIRLFEIERGLISPSHSLPLIPSSPSNAIKCVPISMKRRGSTRKEKENKKHGRHGRHGKELLSKW